MNDPLLLEFLSYNTASEENLLRITLWPQYIHDTLHVTIIMFLQRGSEFLFSLIHYSWLYHEATVQETTANEEGDIIATVIMDEATGKKYQAKFGHFKWKS